MSAQNGRNMDRPPLQGGSVRRARERAEAGLPRDDDLSSLPSRMPFSVDEEPQIVQPPASRRPAVGTTAGQSRPPRPQAPAGLQNKDGGIGLAISRPTQVPQWPLQGPLLSPASSTSTEPYRPPPGSQPPPRPPRPSRVPSILDGSKIQEHTPVFQYRPQSGRESNGQELTSVPETPTTTMSRPSTLSSVGSIPDFPLPVQLPIAPPRRSVNLGPPPSARRGASSFYSNASYVSPIPEESPRSRSHASFASSAAMPESWGTPSPGPSPNYPDAYYDDIMEESGQSAYGDDDPDQDESRLVRSASIGKRAKPTLVTATTPRALEPPDLPRPGPSPVQNGPFREGTGYVEGSSSSGTLPTKAGQTLTADLMLNAVSAASSTDSSSRATPSPQPPPGGRPYSRLSAIRRPPRLDIDAVKKAEARGSLTSLPDLIRRATRLAASLERGRRPASRFDDLNDFPDLAFGGRDGEKEMSYLDAEKHQSGLSDMLAAFPPPAQATAPRRSIRESIRASMQWPLPVAAGARGPSNLGRDELAPPPQPASRKRGRRCCGLPLWGFIIVMIIIIILIAAAIIIPIELFVVRRPNNDNQALQQCQAQITCQNGGTNVVTNGFCSCICTNGFTGFDCTVSDSVNCATSSTTDSNVNNATIGDAIPRLIQQAQLNFSIPLSQTSILGKLNSGNLSCTAENALVTFNGQSSRLLSTVSAAEPDVANGAALEIIDGVAMTTLTIVINGPTTFTLRHATAGPPLVNSPLVSPTISASIQLGAGAGFSTIVTAPTSFSTIFATTFTFGTSLGGGKSSVRSTTPSPTMTSTITTTMTMSSASPTAPMGSTFAVTEDVIDFSRVAVLFILQQESLDSAKTAQGLLQSFFTAQASAASPAALASARSLSIGNGNSVNLVTFQLTTPNGTVGGTRSSTARRRWQDDEPALLTY